MILLDGATLSLARARVVASRVVVEAKAAGPATEPAAQPCRGRGRIAAGPCGSRRDGAARERAGQGLIGHPRVHLALVLVGDGDTWDQGLRGEVPMLTDDRSSAPDIAAITKWIRDRQLE